MPGAGPEWAGAGPEPRGAGLGSGRGQSSGAGSEPDRAELFTDAVGGGVTGEGRAPRGYRESRSQDPQVSLPLGPTSGSPSLYSPLRASVAPPQ